MINFLGCKCTVQLFIHHHPQLSLGRAALDPFILQPVLIPRIPPKALAKCGKIGRRESHWYWGEKTLKTVRQGTKFAFTSGKNTRFVWILLLVLFCYMFHSRGFVSNLDCVQVSRLQFSAPIPGTKFSSESKLLSTVKSKFATHCSHRWHS